MEPSSTSHPRIDGSVGRPAQGPPEEGRLPLGSTFGTSGLADHLFRREAGRMVSSLVHRLGVRHLALAEDAVQDALLRALETWKFGEAPENPSAWLMRAAHNRAIDLLRREGHAERLFHALARSPAFASGPQEIDDREERGSDELWLMFSCCDPALQKTAQVAVILKYLCGFSVREVAQAFLSSEAAIEKQLYRSRRTLESLGALFRVEDQDHVRSRLPSVRSALYLLFSEGYHGAHTGRAIREDLCFEAMRLAELLSRLPLGAGPQTQALLALFCFLAARLPARQSDDGNLLLLAEQDRSRWDALLVSEGLRRLALSAEGETLSSWHLEAAIAARHAAASSFDATDWTSIRRLYDLLFELTPTPIVALNRAIAVGMEQGPDSGLVALDQIENAGRLLDYPFFPAARAHFELSSGRMEEAARSLERAMELARNPAEKALLARKLAACKEP